ncbi:N-acetylmuramoyl-L-alanine amidase, partial [Prevotella copri]
PESEVGAHARHYNAHSIGICYEGGLDKNGKPVDTRTPAQNQALYSLLESLCLSYPDAEILGHRDLPNVHKDCPSFDVKRWLKLVDFHI